MSLQTKILNLFFYVLPHQDVYNVYLILYLEKMGSAWVSILSFPFFLLAKRYLPMWITDYYLCQSRTYLEVERKKTDISANVS